MSCRRRRHQRRCFSGTLSSLITDALPASATGKPVEIWFSDEARVGQKGTLTYVWAPVGSRPAMARDHRHDSAYLFGAICPARGCGAAVIMPAANTEAMNEHLQGHCQLRGFWPDRSGWAMLAR